MADKKDKPKSDENEMMDFRNLKTGDYSLHVNKIFKNKKIMFIIFFKIRLVIFTRNKRISTSN